MSKAESFEYIIYKYKLSLAKPGCNEGFKSTVQCSLETTEATCLAGCNWVQCKGYDVGDDAVCSSFEEKKQCRGDCLW